MESVTCPKCCATTTKGPGSPKGCPMCHFERAEAAPIQPLFPQPQYPWTTIPQIPWLPYILSTHCETCGLPFYAQYIGQFTCQGHISWTVTSGTSGTVAITNTDANSIPASNELKIYKS